MGFVKDVWNGVTGKSAADASKNASKVQSDSAKYSADLQKEMFDQSRQDQMPWLQAGGRALGSLETMVNNPKDFNFEADPGYQFRKQQGMDGIQASAAAGGGLQSGATLKALTDFNQNLAAQEYGDAYKRNFLENEQQYNQLASLAGVGQTTAGSLGALGANAAQGIGDARMQGANANAAGIIGAANAKAQGMGNLMQLGGSLLGGLF